MADKDYTLMYEEMEPMVSRFITVTPDNPRALPAAELAEFLKRYGKPVTACDTVEQGVAEAIAQAGPNGTVLAFGSLYMAGTVRTTVLRSK